MLAHRGQRLGDLALVGRGRGRPALELARVQQGRQVLGHLAEEARLATGLAGLDPIPVGEDLAGICHLGVAEDVRMAADQLLAAVLGDLGQRAGAPLLEQEREEVDLEEHVAQLVEQLGVVARLGGVGQLVGLLDGVRDDRALVLVAVPRALAAQAPGQLVEALERRGAVSQPTAWAAAGRGERRSAPAAARRPRPRRRSGSSVRSCTTAPGSPSCSRSWPSTSSRSS
ncbi:MAG: hypothetical protein QOH02_68 [Gaiellaceae bacterium]|nr:hypothetical protein [Gaiellaceae bacterium]